MDFMAILFISLCVLFFGMNVWDHWEERTHKLFGADGRFLRYQFLRALIVSSSAEPIVLPPDAKFAIQSAGKAHRCEVCHQPDCFDVVTGYCQRCEHKTI